jgi:hypothetical protein
VRCRLPGGGAGRHHPAGVPGARPCLNH